MLDILLKKEDLFYFYEFDYPNALKFCELEEKYRNRAEKISDLNEIKNIINKKSYLKVFCGSLYMLGKIFSEIDI